MKWKCFHAALIAACVSNLLMLPTLCRAGQFLWFTHQMTNNRNSGSAKAKKIDGNPESPADWTKPVNYYQGTVYHKLELLDQPTNTELRWQTGDANGKCKEAWGKLYCCSRGPGTYYWTSTSWWTCQNGAEKEHFLAGFFSKGNERRTGRVLIKKSYKDKVAGGTPWISGDDQLRLPLTWRITVYVVSKGGTFNPPLDWGDRPTTIHKKAPDISGKQSFRPLRKPRRFYRIDGTSIVDNNTLLLPKLSIIIGPGRKDASGEQSKMIMSIPDFVR